MGKLAKWMLFQEFEFTIQHCPGTQHVVADFLLSRMDNGENVWKDDDDFLDVDILRIAMITSRAEKKFPDRWLMEMMYLLTTGLRPPQLRMEEKKRVMVQSRNFCLVEGVSAIP